mmetsp:Transcript_28452/g.87038  ORF Transcript_28452/g.87038 Transcript_28452/m.87038 type:complete len:178 (-) Transcript_28452:247-780(-)
MPTAPSSCRSLAPFDAQLPSELSVRQGDFVLVLSRPAPQGWCHVQGSTGQNGLVPWFYLISAAHAKLEAATAHLDDDEGLSTDAPAFEIKKKKGSSLGVAARAPPGQPAGGEYLEVVAMRGQTGLGLDLDKPTCCAASRLDRWPRSRGSSRWVTKSSRPTECTSTAASRAAAKACRW